MQLTTANCRSTALFANCSIKDSRMPLAMHSKLSFTKMFALDESEGEGVLRAKDGDSAPREQLLRKKALEMQRVRLLSVFNRQK